MDSSSIVCTSDHVRRLYDPHAILIDTMSFYDESETTWNERPYFSVVEAKRGKAGIHLETSFMDRTFDPAQGVYLLPGADSSAIEWERKLQNHFEKHGFRSVLSGVGGDEVLGGVPTSLPELADCAMSGNLNLLLRRTIAWCLVDRRPLIHMLFDTVRFTAHLYRRPQIAKANIPRWIAPRLRRRYVEFVDPPETRSIRGWGRSPSAVNNGLTWWAIMETLPHLRPASLARYEYRYPYLDRDLVDFIFRIPREQVVRPGRRRSLMRRALRDLVPVEILERRRKAYLARGPVVSLQKSRDKIEKLFANSVTAKYGLIDPAQLRSAIDLAATGQDQNWTHSLLRSIGFELWLGNNSRVTA